MGFLESIESWSSPRNLIVMIIASFVVIIVMAMLTQIWVYDVYGEVTMPDTRFTYSFTEISDAFNTLGQTGLYVWAQAHLLDFIFPLTYMFAMSFGINLEIRKLPLENIKMKYLVLFPLLGGIADYAENILVLTQVVAYPNLSEPVIVIASVVTSMKWIFLIVGFVVIFALLLALVPSRLRAMNK